MYLHNMFHKNVKEFAINTKALLLLQTCDICSNRKASFDRIFIFESCGYENLDRIPYPNFLDNILVVTNLKTLKVKE